MIHHGVGVSVPHKALMQTLRFDEDALGQVQKMCSTVSGRYEITRARIVFTEDLLM